MKVDITSSAGLLVRPGDVLVLVVDGHLDPAAADGLRDQVRALMPDLADVAVINGVTAVVAYRPHPAGETPNGDDAPAAG